MAVYTIRFRNWRNRNTTTMRRTLTLIITLGGFLAAAGVANAQSVGAPAGRDAATAPGGTEGLAGPRNEAEAIRSGDAIPVPPRTDGIPVREPSAEPPGTVREPGIR